MNKLALAALVSSAIVAPCILSGGAASAAEAGYDPLRFDCFNIRRDASFLELVEPASEAAITHFSCVDDSCVHRHKFTAEDGAVSEVFRHIYFPEGGRRYVLTSTLWTENSESPETHLTRLGVLYGCFTMTPDEKLWTLDMGTIRYEGDEIHATPVGEYRPSYFYAPTRLLGDWSHAAAITFEKKSSGGYYLPAYFENVYGDVVLKNGAMRATYEIPKHHTGEWRQFRVPLDGPDWRLQAGATSVGDILKNVTSFQIRAEYGNGPDVSAIRNVVIE